MKYEFQDFFNLDSPLDDEVEESLGIRILGEPTKDDLEDLVNFYEENKTRIFMEQDVGVRKVFILPNELMENVDYRGEARKRNGRIRIFSGEFDDDKVHHHEWTHFAIWYLKDNNPSFIEAWKDVAGEYNKVERVNGNLFYVDGGEGFKPKQGYIRGYGGIDFEEDIATYVQEIVRYPERLLGVKDSFAIYEKKLELLRDVRLITLKEYETATTYLEMAQERLGMCVPN